MQSALATVLLLGTVVLLMSSSLRQASQTAMSDVASQASTLSSIPTDATKQKPGQVAALHQFRKMQAARAQAAPIATVELPPKLEPVGTVKPPPGAEAARSAASCLITKWGAIWLMDVKTKQRSHVQHPTEDCEQKALTVMDETLDRFPKAHGGLGAYALDAAASRAACAARMCTQTDLPKGSAAQPKAVVSSPEASPPPRASCSFPAATASSCTTSCTSSCSSSTAAAPAAATGTCPSSSFR